MNPNERRRHVLRAGIALGTVAFAGRARACEYFTTTLRIRHPWTRATGLSASIAIVCMTFDEVSEDDRLIGLQTPVAAGAELVGAGAGAGLDLAIPAGRETVLSEAGTYIRLVGLEHPLLIARAYPLKLMFEKGGAVNATLNVDYMGVGLPAALQSTS